MDLQWPNPKDYKDKEKLVLDYQSKFYEAEVAKKIIEYIESAPEKEKEIKERVEKDDYVA